MSNVIISYVLVRILIWIAYIIIPAKLLYHLSKHPVFNFPYLKFYCLYVAFIILCGILTIIGNFSQPLYAIYINWIAFGLLFTVIITVWNAIPQTFLLDNYRKYINIINHVSEAIIIINVDGKIIECNNSVKTMFGYTQEELLGQEIETLLPHNLRQFHKNLLKELKNKPRPLRTDLLEGEALHKDGHLVPVAISLTASLYDGYTIYIGVIRDISIRKANERRIQLLVDTLNLRLALAENLVFSLVHDLNAPLRVIEGFSEILLEDYGNKLDEQGKDYLKRMCNASARQRALIKDMLRLSQVTQPDIILKKEEVDISAMCADIIEWHRDMFPNRKVSVFIQQYMTAFGDKSLLNTVLTNLISNAWKFSEKSENASIEVGEKNGIFYVKDNGVGFDMSEANQLFKPFSRLSNKKDFEGNGVGLSIVKQIINLHNGKVWAEAELNKGATFYFTIGNEYGNN